jgi:hypothetical protein
MLTQSIRAADPVGVRVMFEGRPLPKLFLLVNEEAAITDQEGVAWISEEEPSDYFDISTDCGDSFSCGFVLRFNSQDSAIVDRPSTKATTCITVTATRSATWLLSQRYGVTASVVAFAQSELA